MPELAPVLRAAAEVQAFCRTRRWRFCRALPFEEHCVQRASLHSFARGCRVTTCSAEDLIVHKCFANRAIDWFDVEGILARQQGRLNLALIRRELKPLLELKGAPELLDELNRRIKRIG